RAVFVAEHAHPQTHAFNRSFHARYTDHIANVILIFEQDEETIDEIMNQCLRAETDCESSNARAGQHRTQIQAKQRKNFQSSNKRNNKHAYAGNYTGHGPELLDTHSRRQLANVNLRALTCNV